MTVVDGLQTFRKMAEKKFYTWKWVDDQIDKIGEKLEGLEISGLVSEILNNNRPPTSTLGYRNPSEDISSCNSQVITLSDFSLICGSTELCPCGIRLVFPLPFEVMI
mgnify:CR=1 FL=1